MENDFLFIKKHSGGAALPAIITTPTAEEIEVDVLYEAAQSDTLNIENINPTAAVQSRSIANKTITNAGDINGNTTIDIDELLEDDEGKPLTDENDNALYAAAQYRYKIKKKYSDAEGITLLELTTNV